MLFRSGQCAQSTLVAQQRANSSSAGHLNDPAGHISDILAYHSTIQYLKQWVDDANQNGTPTILISVSDHETGDISLGRQLGTAYPEYAW